MTARQASDHPQTHHRSPRTQPPPQPRHSTHQEPVPARSACTPPSSSTRPHSPERGPCHIANQNATARATAVSKMWKLFTGEESLASRHVLDSAAPPPRPGTSTTLGRRRGIKTGAWAATCTAPNPRIPYAIRGGGEGERGDQGRVPPSAPSVTSPSIRAPSLNVQEPSTVSEVAPLRLGAPAGKRCSKSPTSL